MSLKERIRQKVARKLLEPDPFYRKRVFNNVDNLYRYIQKGDIVLVEGRAKISRWIKLFTNSHWSHSAIYVGDELIADGAPDRQDYLDIYGNDAQHLVIEAYTGLGVRAAPLSKYIDHNIRVCRPFAITQEDLDAVVAACIADLGKHYDDQNIIEIAMTMLPNWLNPFRKQQYEAWLGSQDEFKVICSGMIARAFQQVNYPIVPLLRTNRTGLEPGQTLLWQAVADAALYPDSAT